MVSIVKELSLNTEKLEELAESYDEGRLQFVVGAGASMAAGLPGWSELNVSLVADYFNKARQNDDTPKAIEYEDEELDALADVFADHFGQNAVIDLLREDLEEQTFRRYLHDALYQGRQTYDLQPLHYELGAAVHQRLDDGDCGHLYTLNYDDILESALEEITGERPEPMTEIGEVSPNSVVHLHGFMPLEPEEAGEVSVKGEVILSEKDYLRTRGGNPDQQLERLLSDSDSDIVLLGTSLSDPRLRRLLYKRLEARNEEDNESDDGKIWVFLARKSPSSEADLARRRAEKMAANHTAPYWQDWEVEVLHIDNHEVLPTALRTIRLGGDVTEWLEKGIDFLEGHRCYEELYDRDRQAKAQLKLIRTHEFVRQRFEIDLEEDLTFTFFVPMRPPEDGDPVYLQQAFRFSDPHRRYTREGKWLEYPADKADAVSDLSSLVRDGAVHLRILEEDEASRRRLKVESFEQAEGATGLAVATGIIADARDSETFFRKFDKEKRQEWSDEKTYSSLLSIPVYDSAQWVPIGAACIASIRREPFWERLEPAEQRNLERHMRSTFRNLVDYPSRF